MDGRTQRPVDDMMRKEFGVDYVDSITEPGPIKFLAENTDKSVVEQIKNRVLISVEKHGSNAVGIVGHYDCAGNPVDKDVQLEQIEKSISLVKQWVPNVDVFGIWVDSDWVAVRL